MTSRYERLLNNAMHVRRLSPRVGRRCRDAGFTLVELLVVVVIIGLLIAIAIPMFLRYKQSAYVASTKADMHTLQLEEQDYYTNSATFASTRQLITANPSLKLSPGSVAVVIWSSDAGYCIGAANTNGPVDNAAPFAGNGYPYQTSFFDSTTGVTSTTMCPTPAGATGLDGSLLNDTGGH